MDLFSLSGFVFRGEGKFQGEIRLRPPSQVVALKGKLFGSLLMSKNLPANDNSAGVVLVSTFD